MPYRDELRPIADKLRRAAETELAQRNMLAWRNASVAVTAVTSLWPYLHIAPLAGLHLTAALIAGLCAMEEWRLRREARRRFAELTEDGTSPLPPAQG